MRFLKSCMKALGMIALICVLALSFSPSKAFAQSTTRTLVLDGTVDIVDDETFGDEKCLNLPVEGEITLDEGKSGNLIDFRYCCGNEVRAELFLDAALKSFSNFEVDGYAHLYEGTSCDTDDLEDEMGVGEAVTPNRPLSLDINLENSGIGSGDTADFELVFINKD